MQTHSIYVRLTHRYRAGWAHLDRHEHIIDLKLTPPRLVHRDEDDTTQHVLFGRISAKQMRSLREIWRPLSGQTSLIFRHWLQIAISNTFESGCQCEHDCCGHYQSYAVAELSGRRVVVNVRSYRNL